MSDYIQIQWTCGSIDEARKICRFLVQERLIACANILPWVESIFMWDQQLDTSQETKVYLKTRASLYEEVKQVILDNCRYEVPEILVFSIEGGNSDYLNWLEESLLTAK